MTDLIDREEFLKQKGNKVDCLKMLMRGLKGRGKQENVLSLLKKGGTTEDNASRTWELVLYWQAIPGSVSPL